MANAFESVLNGKCKVRFSNHISFAGVFLMLLFIATFYLTRNSGRIFEEQQQQQGLVRNDQKCDFFSGKWIYDNVSYPLYKEQQCSFIPDYIACKNIGRKDFKYQNWRWQPHDCDLPWFNATAFLEKLRGKKLYFVGDSINQSQWASITCLLDSSIPPSSRTLTWKDNYGIFQATDYNATLHFYWSPFLVESNCDDPKNIPEQEYIVKIEAIEKNARYWTDADILIFDSFTWWMKPKVTPLWGAFGSPNTTYLEGKTRQRAYEVALKTWSNWLDININRTKTKLFFMSMSPYHIVGEEWGLTGGRNCYGENEPILSQEKLGGLINREMMEIAETAIHELETKGVKVEYINITNLSAYRKDAHSSVYKNSTMPQTKEQQLDAPQRNSDCIHWCLPGVPDIWNQILYAYIMN